jgi:hypothetical protein
MWLTSLRKKITASDTGPLVLSALFLIALHTATNGQYGFHRDELATIDDARLLDWGYVVYPPITPLIARLSLTLFGPSLVALRFFAALAMGIAMVITGLMARDLGAQRPAQLLAAWAAAISPVAITVRHLFQYVAFDYLAWVLTAWFIIRLLNSAASRWWLAIGAAAGLGTMTKYTIAFFLTALFAAILITGPRTLLNRYFCLGLLLALLIFLPNLLWQIRHHFISLDFLQYIHARDIRLGRTDNFLLNQFWVSTQVVTAPLWLAGLYYLFTPAGKRYRMLGWIYLITLLLFFFAKGRDYYLSPAYPMLFAAGAAWSDQWLATLSPRAARIARGTAWRTLAIAGILVAAIVLPLAPPGSRWWQIADTLNGNFNEEFGWPQMADAVIRARDSLPPDSAPVGILAGDAGEAAAINLYGRGYGLPEVISGSNSHWLRGYGNPPPKTVIAAGFRRANLDPVFESCDSAGRFQIPFGITNSAIGGPNTEIFVCTHPRQPWNVFWPHFRSFG